MVWSHRDARNFDIGNERLNRLVYEMLMPQPGDHILDLDCGTGKLVHIKVFNLCLIKKMDLEKWAKSKAVEVRHAHFTKPWSLAT